MFIKQNKAMDLLRHRINVERRLLFEVIQEGVSGSLVQKIILRQRDKIKQLEMALNTLCNLYQPFSIYST